MGRTLATYLFGISVCLFSHTTQAGQLEGTLKAYTAPPVKEYRSYLDDVDGTYMMHTKNAKGASASFKARLWVNGKNNGDYVIRLKRTGMFGATDYSQESTGHVHGTDLISDRLDILVDAGIFGKHKETHTFGGTQLQYQVDSSFEKSESISITKPTRGHVNDLLAILVDQGFSHKKGSAPQSYNILSTGQVGSLTFSQDHTSSGKYSISVLANGQQLFDTNSHIVYASNGRIQSFHIKMASGATMSLKPHKP